VTIVQLADLDTFLRDSLSIVRRGVANARNANQSNPSLGIMADLPDKVDFEVMVVSNHQYLNRASSTSSSNNEASTTGADESERQNGVNISSDSSRQSKSDVEASLSGDHTSSIGSDVSSESSIRSEIKNDTSNESSSSLNVKVSGSTNRSTEVSSEIATEINLESERGQESSGDRVLGNSGSKSTNTESGNGTRSETRTSTINAVTTKTEKSNSRQSGNTLEMNVHQVKGFDQATGRWGSQSFAPVVLPGQTLKCS
jgi:hypothetical protein